MAIAASLRALLERSIDYAGLFPPASLELDQALANHAQYGRIQESWILNAFVLPFGQFATARQFLSRFDSTHRLCISVLGPKTENSAAFRSAVVETEAAIREMRNADLVSISQLEMYLPDGVDFSLLKEASRMIAGVPAFWEAPLDRAEQTIALLSEHNANAGPPTFGYKMRTGGVTADAFPASAQIARALVAAATHQVPIKFTAGLHHPLRQYREEVQTKMHGFLNVLGAAVLAAEHQWDVAQTAAMLEDEEAGSFRFDDEFFAWRESKISVQRVRDRRKLVTTFGSCSFDEPREDLRSLALL